MLSYQLSHLGPHHPVVSKAGALWEVTLNTYTGSSRRCISTLEITTVAHLAPLLLGVPKPLAALFCSSLGCTSGPVLHTHFLSEIQPFF